MQKVEKRRDWTQEDIHMLKALAREGKKTSSIAQVASTAASTSTSVGIKALILLPGHGVGNFVRPDHISYEVQIPMAAPGEVGGSWAVGTADHRRCTYRSSRAAFAHPASRLQLSTTGLSFRRLP